MRFKKFDPILRRQPKHAVSAAFALATTWVSKTGRYPFNISTLSAISIPGLNLILFRADTMTASPVRGLRASRALLFLTSNTPKLRSSIRPSATRASTMPSNTRCTTSKTSAVPGGKTASPPSNAAFKHNHGYPTVDPLKQIAESKKLINTVHITTVIRPCENRIPIAMALKSR